MSANSNEHLAKMANQIILNIPAASAEEKIASAASHMDKFWSPLMKRQIGEYIASGGQELTPAAAEAAAKMLQ